MNRTDGLVRRNKSRANENGNGEANSSQANSVDENDVIIKDREDDVDDTDSKETRLTLMEEVLLLGLKDKEVISFAVYIEVNGGRMCGMKNSSFVVPMWFL